MATKHRRMDTKLRLADMATDCARTRVFTVHEGLEYLDSASGLIRHEYDDHILWVGEGCETQNWIAIYEPIQGRFRVVKEVKFTTPVWDPTPRIETFCAESVQTLDELAAMVEDALFQLKKAREEFAEYTRITRKAKVRNAAREYEV